MLLNHKIRLNEESWRVINGETQYYNMVILYKCNVNPIKIPKSGFLEFTKLVPKFIQRIQI